VSAVAISLTIFACVCAGVLLGMLLGATLPAQHLSPESRDVVKVGMGLIGTMTALVLGLVLASAKSSFDTKNGQVRQTAVVVIVLDRTLARYGPETKDIRDLIRQTVAQRLDTTWPEESSRSAPADTAVDAPAGEVLEDRIRALSPQNDAQRALQSRALQLTGDVLQARWLIFEKTGSSIPLPFLVILIFWLTVLFASFGLVAPRNATVLTVLLICAMSVSAALFLILEMDRPFEGMLKISSAPLRYTLAHLGQ
jgi:hypothetical protein